MTSDIETQPSVVSNGSCPFMKYELHTTQKWTDGQMECDTLRHHNKLMQMWSGIDCNDMQYIAICLSQSWDIARGKLLILRNGSPYTLYINMQAKQSTNGVQNVQ